MSPRDPLDKPIVSRLGPFVLDAPLASGGMGTVWRARHEDVPVAVKVLDQVGMDDLVEAFRGEVRAVAALDHPGVVMVLDHGEVSPEEARFGTLEAGAPWMAMELASGGTLQGFKARMAWPQLKATLLAVLDALAHAHARGVVHRDLKPSNVLVATRQDARPGLKISDFGIAHALADAERTGFNEKLVAGTPRYMAPEQVLGEWRDYGPWTDLYSLGCMVYYLASEASPFPGKRGAPLIMAQVHDAPAPLAPLFPMPRGFDAWLATLLRKDPYARFRCAADAAWALLQLEDVPGGSAPGPDLEEAVDATKVSLGETWRLTLDAVPGTRPARAPQSDRPAPAPIPLGWRSPRPAPAPPTLRGAGVSLFGLRDIPLVGRVDERNLLWQELREVADSGRARLVLIRGPAGTGKSRLAEWLVRRALETGAANASKATFSAPAAPGEALKRMGTSYFRAHELPLAEIEHRVHAFLQAYGVEDPDQAAVLTAILSSPTPAELAAGKVPVRLTRPSEYYMAVRNAMAVIASERPLVTWFDDVQWGAHGLGLARWILRTRDESPFPVLLVLTLRDEDLEGRELETEGLERLMAMPGTTEIRLGPLSRAVHSRLVRTLLGLEGDLAAMVEERTAGNPLFAVQLVGDWVQRGLLRAGRRGFQLARGAQILVPDDVHQVWLSRIERVLREFPERAVSQLEIAAILGQEVDAREWGQACDDPQGLFGDRFPGDRALRANLVDELIRDRLVIGSLERWRFVHPMLRESLQRGAEEAGRAQAHHLACASMLWARAAAPQLAPAERLGRHLLAAGQTEEAIAPLLAGVETRLISAGPKLALALLGQTERAMRDLGLPATDPRWGKVWTFRGRIHRSLGELDRAEQFDGRALEAARRHGWRGVERYALLGTAETHMLRGDLDTAQSVLERCSQAAMEAGSARHAAVALRQRAAIDRLRAQQCDVQAGLPLLEQSVERLRQAADFFGLARAADEAVPVQRELGECFLLMERFDEAVAAFEQAASAAERQGVAGEAAASWYGLGRVQWRRGDRAGASEALSRALSRLEALGSDEAGDVRPTLALIRAEQGEVEEAARLVREEVASFARLDHDARGVALAGVELVRAAVERRWERFDGLLVEACGPGAPPIAARLVYVAAAVAEHHGDLARRDRAFEVTRTLLRDRGRSREAGEVGRQTHTGGSP